MGSQVSVLVAADDRSISLTPSGAPHPADDERSAFSASAAGAVADDERSVFSASAAGAVAAFPSDDAAAEASMGVFHPLTQLTPPSPPSPALTKAAAADRYSIVELPDDVSRCVLESMDLSARVKLSICSKALAACVFSKSYLWETIDFGAELSYKQRQLLTDRSLHRLLENVDAKRVTKVMSVRRCQKIQGYSLVPLLGSVVLEDLDFRVTAITYAQGTAQIGLDDSFVISLLESMMPLARPTETNQRTGMTSRLFTVRFNHQRNPTRVGDNPLRMHECFNPYSQVKLFMESFDGSLKARLWADRVPCGHCNCALVDKIPSEVFEITDASSIRCAQCKTLSCGQKGCKSTSRCHRCYSDFCCVDVKRCDSCSRDTCLQCDAVKQCQGPCNRVLCDICSGLAICTCGDCGKYCCEDCEETRYCTECDELFCRSCRDVKYCELCDESFCSTCFTEPVDCSKCRKVLCGWCEKDALHVCDACDSLECGMCHVSPNPCGGCNGLFCCRDVSEKCTTCLEQYCSVCQPFFDPCSMCEKCPSCCSDVSWCSQCEQSFGKECRKVSECRDCGTSFCVDCSSRCEGSGVSPCSYCGEPLCPSCQPESSDSSPRIAGTDDNGVMMSLPILLCNACSGSAHVTGRSSASRGHLACEHRADKKKKASELLCDQLCELKLERARARRRLEQCQGKVRKVEQKLFIKDAGWFPCDNSE